jgi:hypothetical protein
MAAAVVVVAREQVAEMWVLAAEMPVADVVFRAVIFSAAAVTMPTVAAVAAALAALAAHLVAPAEPAEPVQQVEWKANPVIQIAAQHRFQAGLQ